MTVVEIKGKAPLEFSGEHIISRLVDFILKDIRFFQIGKEVLLTYNKIEDFDEAMFRQLDVPIFQRIYQKMNQIDLSAFFSLIEEVYKMSPIVFKDFRGDFTEYIVTKIGPFDKDIDALCVLREATFWINDKRIQDQSGRERKLNFDISFSNNKRYTSIIDIACESHECKIRIETFLSYKEHKQPPINEAVKDKIEFMDFMMDSFRESKLFSISFATFTDNVDRSRDILNRLGIKRLKIINGEAIMTQLEEIMNKSS